MNKIKRKLSSFRKIFISPGMTKPIKLGEKILLLGTAPSATYFFNYTSVRKQFEDYDIAMINFMPLFSKDEMFEIKPKYLILIDPIFYDNESWDRMNLEDWRREDVKKLRCVLSEIDWPCTIVTSVLENFRNIGVKNTNLSYLRLSIFKTKYKKIKLNLFKCNIANFGTNNVIMGALYFAITFGYLQVAILGCPYRDVNYDMQPDGLHIHEHLHYYDLEREEVLIPYDELFSENESFSMKNHKRGYEGSKTMWQLRKYAELLGAKVTNYSEGSQIDSIRQGILDMSDMML